MSEAAVPEHFYWFIGFLIVTNIGALGSAVVLLVKVSFNLGMFKERMDRNQADVNAAHQKIREIEKCAKTKGG